MATKLLLPNQREMTCSRGDSANHAIFYRGKPHQTGFRLLSALNIMSIKQTLYQLEGFIQISRNIPAFSE